MSNTEYIPIAALNQYAYCPHRYWRMFCAGEFTDNQYTIEGTSLHSRVHTLGEGHREETWQVRAIWHIPDFQPEMRQGWITLIERVINIVKLPKLNEERLLKKAKQFLELIASEQAWELEDKERRWKEIKEEVKATGTYTHTYEELAYGAQVAWRNASKCVGRIAWNNMVVRDRRHVTDPDEMFRELQEHVRFATNGGNVQITMTVFRPKQPKERWGDRIWNSQLYRYAAYKQPDGSILGDPANDDVFEVFIAIARRAVGFAQSPNRLANYHTLRR